MSNRSPLVTAAFLLAAVALAGLAWWFTGDGDRTGFTRAAGLAAAALATHLLGTPVARRRGPVGSIAARTPGLAPGAWSGR